MRKTKAETAKTRQKILESASQAFRAHGINATGVAEIMAAAGLTHGGFYRHFDSKEELVSEALDLNRKDFVAGAVDAANRGAEAVLQRMQAYVSQRYRDDIGGGCPLAANASEIVRGDITARHNATEAFRGVYEATAPYMRASGDLDPTDVSISLLTNMIGALTISRMVDDPALSEKILDVTRRRIAQSIDLGAPTHGRHADETPESPADPAPKDATHPLGSRG